MIQEKYKWQQLGLARILFVFAFLIVGNIAFAHDIVKTDMMSATASGILYLKLGYEHIVPLGPDHILFVVSLFLLNPKLKTILWQSLAFTVAHSVTLGLAMYKVITVPSGIIEPLIALSIAYVALENVFVQKLKPSRIGVIFLFGLVHGLGFAGALAELGLPSGAYLTSLLLFNIGVELGQLTIILALFLLLGKWFGKKPYYHKYIVVPVSLLIAGVSFYWVVERVYAQGPSKTIVKKEVVDGFIKQYSSSPVLKTTSDNLAFWEQRMDSLPDYYVNGPEYAAALISSFRLKGEVRELMKADSLYRIINKVHDEKEPGILRTMAGLSMLQHKFPEADSFLKKAITIEGNTFPNAFLDFDIAFEHGDYTRAEKLLPALQRGNEYGFYFRKAKYEHYKGQLDAAIASMKMAAEKAGNNIYLKHAALSNTADLYMHKGDISSAYDFYIKSLETDASDIHSIAGLGWIALVQDKNIVLADSILMFVYQNNRAPDIYLKLSQLEEAKGNTGRQKDFVFVFADKLKWFGWEKMYTRNLVDVYTGLLDDPARAVELSLQEISNRPTPQVFAWYAWSLYCNKKPEKAWQVYKGYVDGKPLEGPELYYMGKMMQGLKKDHEATRFFKAAWKNRYDLSPSRQKELEDYFGNS